MILGGIWATARRLIAAEPSGFLARHLASCSRVEQHFRTVLRVPSEQVARIAPRPAIVPVNSLPHSTQVVVYCLIASTVSAAFSPSCLAGFFRSGRAGTVHERPRAGVARSPVKRPVQPLLDRRSPATGSRLCRPLREPPAGQTAIADDRASTPRPRHVRAGRRGPRQVARRCAVPCPAAVTRSLAALSSAMASAAESPPDATDRNSSSRSVRAASTASSSSAKCPSSMIRSVTVACSDTATSRMPCT